MPFQLYSYKQVSSPRSRDHRAGRRLTVSLPCQGSRSTPKLRRNKSNYELKHGNCSVDSFSSLRPGSPDMMGQTMPNSPISIGSPPEFGFAAALSPTGSPEQQLAQNQVVPPLALHSGAAKRRSHQALPPVPSIPSAFRSTSRTCGAQSLKKTLGVDEGYADFRLQAADASPQPPKQAASNEQVPLPPELVKGYAAADLSNAPGLDSETTRTVVRAVVDLQVGSSSVVLVRRRGQLNDESRIYDCKGNEISYTFGGFDELHRQYERAEGSGDVDATGDRKTGGWKRFSRWRKGILRSKQASRAKATHEMEIWHLKKHKSTV